MGRTRPRPHPAAGTPLAVATFPIVLVIWIVIAMVRNSESGGATQAPSPDFTASRSLTTQSMFRVFTGISALFCAGLLTTDPTDPGVITGVTVACLALTFPGWILPLTAVMPIELSFNLVLAVGWNWSRSHPEAGAVIDIARNRRLTASEAEWLLAVLSRSGRWYALTSVAAGAVHANRGEMLLARTKYARAARCPPSTGAEPARAMAREWLVAEALSRAAWGEAADWAERGEALPKRVRSLAAVVESFRMSQALPLVVAQQVWQGRLRLALRLSSPLPAPEVDPFLGVSRTEYASLAFALHRRALTGDRQEDVVSAAAAWDRAANTLPNGILDERETELADVMWKQRWFPNAKGSLERASDCAWERAFQELSDRVYDLRSLMGTHARAPTAEDAFEKWEPLAALAERMCADRPHERAMVFGMVAIPMLNVAAEMFNVRGLRYFGHVVFRWLQVEGEGVIDESLAETLAGNVACGV